jgi:CRISPR type III-A-associated RAMP protein Csm4
MNPGLVVKLRPSGPWRIGPDSGARNRVDAVYHSDSLYSAVTSAMARLGWLEEWLDATARPGASAVSFGSCFPFMDEIGFVVPPRTVWPPASHSARAARIRWKSARFVPLTVVQSILAGRRLDENQWSVDGPSDCLVPAGRPGPFRTAVRWSAAVDRLTGATDRHSTACLEFRPGAGLWTVVSFQDEAAQARWAGPVKAAFRLLADTGFGGERSRGWGRSESPEFTEGTLPDLILPPPSEVAEASVKAASPVLPLVAAPESAAPVTELATPAADAVALAEPTASESEPATTEQVPVAEAGEPSPEAVVPVAEPAAIELVPIAELEAPAAEAMAVAEATAPALEQAEVEPVSVAALEAPAAEAVAEATAPGSEPVAAEPSPEAVVPVAEPAAIELVPIAELEAPAAEAVAVPEIPADPAPEPVAATVPAAPTHPHWLLSVFTPAAADTVDWSRGNYTVLSRGGRVDSPAGSGELKKQIHMVAEGSVLFAEAAPRGSAANVAPDGFAHPVFRAGFAVAIPLPEVS